MTSVPQVSEADVGLYLRLKIAYYISLYKGFKQASRTLHHSCKSYHAWRE